jgi:hypothetical protein
MLPDQELTTTPHILFTLPSLSSPCDITSLQDLWNRPVVSAGSLGEIEIPICIKISLRLAYVFH